jgi:transposase
VINIVIGLVLHERFVYGTVMEDNGTIIVQRNMENNMETVIGFLLNYKDHDVVIESPTSGKYLSKELSMLGYKITFNKPCKGP